jgi:hypothetical protein
MNREQLLVPPLIDTMIREMLNAKVDVWNRQSYRNNLAAYRKLIDTAITKYDAEYEKTMSGREQKKKITQR